MNRERDKKEYTNGEITVLWKPSECIHSTICYKNLLEVFNPSKRPWINMQGATSEKIIDIVKRCPTGALTYLYNNDDKSDKPPQSENQPTGVAETKNDPVIIEVIQGGPLMIEGNFIVVGSEEKNFGKKGLAYFCRCGNTRNPPYCDGTHRKIGFDK